MGFPKAPLVVAVTLFVASVVGTLAALGVFFYYDVRFWYFFEVGAVLKIAAALLSGFVVSSGLLFVHFRRQQEYMTFEALFSLLNLLWIAPVLYLL
jgi:hypothetical protein